MLATNETKCNLPPLFQTDPPTWETVCARYPRLRTLACDVVVGRGRVIHRVRREVHKMLRHDPAGLAVVDAHFREILTGGVRG